MSEVKTVTMGNRNMEKIKRSNVNKGREIKISPQRTKQAEQKSGGWVR